MDKPVMMTAKERAIAWENKYAVERKISGELLAALEELERAMRLGYGDCELCEQARAAIAKATE